ncbi:MAG: ribosome-associated translation inhibitor RaiA [Candidatus Eisenbacteria bacterium]|nr:ribosome-associated translation inhibitor RaiA [Candidatus Eisenbacteria bacterium]
MQISTTTRHCELHPEIREFVERRLEKLQRFARDVREVHLVLTAEKHRHAAEITVRLKHHEIVSREESTDARAAIDRAASQLEGQLRRFKERRLERRRSAANGARPGGAAEADGGEAAAED